MKKLWLGLALIVVAFFSYFTLLVRWPVTRDVPWVPFLLFAIAVVLIVAGLRRVFPGGSKLRKVGASVITLAGIAVIAFFVTVNYVEARKLPASPGAPAVGQRAPDFVLPDSNGHRVSLNQLVTTPGSKGVLLVFYRGYW